MGKNQVSIKWKMFVPGSSVPKIFERGAGHTTKIKHASWKKSGSLKKSLQFESVSDFMVFVSENNKKRGVCTWNLSSISGRISAEMGDTKP